MRFGTKSLCLVLLMSLTFAPGCGPRPENAKPQGNSGATGRVADSGGTANETTKNVPPGMAGDFGFTAPEEGITTLVVEGDCEKSILLVSQEWAAAAEKIKATPGLLEAIDRKDDAEVRRILDQSFGKNSAVVSTYFTDANATVKFEAPVGRVERKLHLLKGPHLLAVSNRSGEPAQITVSFKPAN